MPYYCTVPRCTSMAGKVKNVSFHQFPRDEELAKLWNKILKRGKPYTKYSKVCSLHFKPEDYTITSVGKNKGQWRTLRKDAIPSQNLPSDSPVPYQRHRNTGSWVPSGRPPMLDPQMQQQMAQAIYMQTMLAMQAAGTTDAAAPLCNGIQAKEESTSNLNETQEINSYKCAECLKCFKDPDVFILHQRAHTKNKENYTSNKQLKSNPILANLLKTQGNDNFYVNNNILSIESQIMAALAVNMENYIRNLMLTQGNCSDDVDQSSSDCDELNESTESKLVIDESV